MEYVLNGEKSCLGALAPTVPCIPGVAFSPLFLPTKSYSLALPFFWKPFLTPQAV